MNEQLATYVVYFRHRLLFACAVYTNVFDVYGGLTKQYI